MVRCGRVGHASAVLAHLDPRSLTPTMWPTLDRTRRRLLGAMPDAASSPAPSRLDAGPATATGRAPAAVEMTDAADDQEPGATQDCVIAIGRPEVQRLAGALQALLGPDTERPDTPARLEAALAVAVERLGGGGLPRVTRRPPGLYTPEAWQVHLVAVTPAVSAALRAAIRTGSFA